MKDKIQIIIIIRNLNKHQNVFHIIGQYVIRSHYSYKGKSLKDN